MLHKSKCLALFLLFSLQLSAQDAKFAGTYYNHSGEPELTLNEDGTFKSITTAYSINSPEQKKIKQESTGNWISDRNQITLNPDKKPREIITELVETTNDDKDSITINIKYVHQKFENETFKSKEVFNFPMLTFLVNKKNSYYTLIRDKKFESLLFYEPKNKIYLDSKNTFKIPKTTLEKVGIDLLENNDIIWIPISDKKSNRLLIEVIQPIDLEFTPRSKKLIIKGKKAYQAIKNGKIDSSVKEYPLVRK